METENGWAGKGNWGGDVQLGMGEKKQSRLVGVGERQQGLYPLENSPFQNLEWNTRFLSLNIPLLPSLKPTGKVCLISLQWLLQTEDNNLLLLSVTQLAHVAEVYAVDLKVPTMLMIHADVSMIPHDGIPVGGFVCALGGFFF